MGGQIHKNLSHEIILTRIIGQIHMLHQVTPVEN